MNNGTTKLAETDFVEAPLSLDGICLDWIRGQRSPKDIRVTVWQRHDLELMLRKNPRTLAEFFSGHLVLPLTVHPGKRLR
jgi:hypothetical protein